MLDAAHRESQGGFRVVFRVGVVRFCVEVFGLHHAWCSFVGCQVFIRGAPEGLFVPGWALLTVDPDL